MRTKIVDAAKIRNSTDTDFSGAGAHKDYAYIPVDEFWLDRYYKAEQPLFLALHDLEKKMRNKPFALIRAEAKKLFTKPDALPLPMTRIEKQGSLMICYVDGRAVRAGLDPYFLLGGHGLVYDYIPKKEVWIDTRQDPKEMKYTLIHELDERARMAKGMSYLDAHDFALATERMARRADGVAHF